MNTAGKAAITANEARNFIGQEDAVLLDVRTPGEFSTKSAPGFINVPLDELNPRRIDQVCAGRRRIYLLCQSGERAEQARVKLEAAGYCGCVIDGGIIAWEKAGLPVNQSGRRCIPLDRQVRIGAGSLVVLGFVLGAAIHHYLIVLSALVGLGLIMSGVTGACPMATLIARMPWNRGSGQASCGR